MEEPSTWSSSRELMTSCRPPRSWRPARRSASRSTSSCSTGRSTPFARTGSRPIGLAPEAGRDGREAVDRLRAAGQPLGRHASPRRRTSAALEIQACSLSMDLLHLQPADLDPLVDGVEGVGLLPERRRRPGRLHLSRWEARRDHSDHADGRRTRAVMPHADREDRPGHQDDPVRRILRGPRNRSGIGQGLRSLVAIDRERDRRAIRGRRRLPLRPATEVRH